ncbi:MAG TPA: flagellar export chaperone FlgN [bacterium]|nr:flagellar export chaperone FlgN [bacterium]
MRIPFHSKTHWDESEVVLDLYQEKLLKFQKYYDLSVSERTALESLDVEELVAIFRRKESVQQQIKTLDKQVHSMQEENGFLLGTMDEHQSAEFQEAINLMIQLLQRIVHYEEKNKRIALSQKEHLQRQLKEIANGDMMLKGYFRRNKPNPRFVDQAR